MPAANTANGPHQPVVNPLRLSIHRNRQTGPMAHDLLKNDACGSTAAGKEADRFPPPPPLAEEGSARAARRKELLLDDEVLDSETWQPRTWVAWRLWAYYVLVTATVGTLWIVGQWSFMRKRLHLLLSRPARQDTCDFIVVTSSKKQGAAVEICEVEAQNEVPIELLTSWSDIRRRRKQNEHVKRSSAGDKGRLMVLYRHTRYFFDPFVSRFLQADNEHYTAPGKVDLRNGLTSREASHRLQLFGRNVIEVPMPSTATLLIRECIHPFVIFQSE